jgi:hypothetical protein
MVGHTVILVGFVDCRARGIDAAAARKVLVYSFGKEVVNRLPSKALQGRIEAAVSASLAAVVLDGLP